MSTALQAAWIATLLFTGTGTLGHTFLGGRRTVAVAPYSVADSGAREVAIAAADSVRVELAATGRWDVYMSVEGGPLSRRTRLSIQPSVEDAVRFGRSLGVEKVVCGAVREASATVSKRESKSSTTYTIVATVTVQHMLVDVATLRVESDTVLTSSARESRSSPYSEAMRSEVLKRLAGQTARLFVRRLVPEVEGRVLARISVDGKPRLLISLGSEQGLAANMDLEFARLEAVVDESGKPVVGSDGQPVMARRRVSALMRPDHKQPTVCVGQPRTIHDNTAEVEVGYYHSVFLGRKFEYRQEAMDAVRVGDLVKPVARPDDIP